MAIELKNEGHNVVYISFREFNDRPIKDFLGILSDSISKQWGVSIKAESIIDIFQEIHRIKIEKTVLINNCSNKQVIQEEDYLAVENNYSKLYLDKNIADTIQKGKKYIFFVKRLLFTEEKIRFEIRHETIKELYFNGIIAPDEDRYITFRVL